MPSISHPSDLSDLSDLTTVIIKWKPCHTSIFADLFSSEILDKKEPSLETLCDLVGELNGEQVDFMGYELPILSSHP